MLHSLQDGRYSILGELGRGGFGITYEASNSRLGKRYAIKEFFMPDICGRGDDGVSVVVPLETNRAIFERQKDRFYQEAGKLAQLYHPHIVTVFDYFEENGTAYYVMDYIEGENLAARLSRTGRPMDEAEVLKILKQVLDALEYIHGQDPPLLHLDIKPANLMIKENGDVVLIDFGASKNLWLGNEPYRHTTFAYSIGFAPREQMEQDIRKIGPWTDFYSLGATLYNLLANRLPPLPSGIDDDTTGDKHVALSFPENVSGRTRKLVHRLMSTQRIRRPQSVEEIRNLLGGNGYPLKPILLVLLALLVVGFFSMMLYNKANDPFDINDGPEEADSLMHMRIVAFLDSVPKWRKDEMDSVFNGRLKGLYDQLNYYSFEKLNESIDSLRLLDSKEIQRLDRAISLMNEDTEYLPKLKEITHNEDENGQVFFSKDGTINLNNIIRHMENARERIRYPAIEAVIDSPGNTTNQQEHSHTPQKR